jgi:hypothetical protein
VGSNPTPSASMPSKVVHGCLKIWRIHNGMNP